MNNSNYKRIIGFSSISFLIAVLILSVYYSNNALGAVSKNFPIWFVPLIAAVIFVACVGFIIGKIRKTDLLKYEFITVVTQKFSMPLQRIRHSIENYQRAYSDLAREASVVEIKKSGIQLVELTDILVGLAKIEGSEYSYRFESISSADLVRDVVFAYEAKINDKNIHVSVTVPHVPPKIFVDINRIHFALEMLVENAVTYTSQGGTMYISLMERKGKVLIDVRDTGKGIKREELGYVFSKFYGGTTTTEDKSHSMGIGLYIAKNIIEKHGGTLSVDSQGLGFGTLFTVTLNAMQ